MPLTVKVEGGCRIFHWRLGSFSFRQGSAERQRKMARSLHGEQTVCGFWVDVALSLPCMSSCLCPFFCVFFSLSREGGGLVRVKLKGRNVSALLWPHEM